MYFTFAKSTSIKDEDLEGTDKIRPQYEHECAYDGTTRTIPSKDTIFRFRKRTRAAVSVTENVGACLACARHCD